ncbi:MAG: glycosyltransferase [Anaerolinea sp.]|nr:glycosyltransferase [Anaerolinea sp.]
MPRVSVLMSVYNGERYLREAVDSILNQTFTDFEFIIVDDGSTDGTAQILDSYSDPRIVRINNEKNLGLAASLNIGIDRAQGEYIARMDADDVSLPHRFETQVKYMGNHPEIDFLGTNLRYMDENSILSEKRLYFESSPLSSTYLKWRLLWGNPLAHPTMLMRRSTLNHYSLRYDPQFSSAQDYDLWTRAARVCNFVAISEVCLVRRKHTSSIASTRNYEQRTMVYKSMGNQLSWFLGFPISPRVISTLGNAFRSIYIDQTDYRMAAYVIFAAHRKFLDTATFTSNEYRLICNHTAKLLSTLSINARNKSRYLAVYILSVSMLLLSKACFNGDFAKLMLKTLAHRKV